MGYTDKLKGLLRPLGIYALDSGDGAAELCAVGAALDEAGSAVEITARECVVRTAEGWGLSSYETMLPRVPAYTDTATRRAAITALLQVHGASFTLYGINAALSGCGIRALAEEAETAQTVSVSFPGTRGIPVGIDEMKLIIEDILPCQLAVAYEYAYITWSVLEASYGLWSILEEMTWDELERAE